MSRKQPAGDKLGVDEFEVINREIDLLLKRLHSKGVCPCCTAQGMVYRGIFLHEEVAGTEETVTLCKDVADAINHSDDADEIHTQH